MKYTFKTKKYIIVSVEDYSRHGLPTLKSYLIDPELITKQKEDSHEIIVT